MLGCTSTDHGSSDRWQCSERKQAQGPESDRLSIVRTTQYRGGELTVSSASVLRSCSQTLRSLYQSHTANCSVFNNDTAPYRGAQRLGSSLMSLGRDQFYSLYLRRLADSVNLLPHVPQLCCGPRYRLDQLRLVSAHERVQIGQFLQTT